MHICVCDMVSVCGVSVCDAVCVSVYVWSGYVIYDPHPTESRWQKAMVKGKDSGAKLCLLGLNPSFTMCVFVTLGKVGNRTL